MGLKISENLIIVIKEEIIIKINGTKERYSQSTIFKDDIKIKEVLKLNL